MNRKEKAIIDDAIANNKRIVFCGGRSCGKRLLQQYALLKQWPTGIVVQVDKDDVRLSELADAVEIKD